MEKSHLYTANQLAHACSVSRATILRLEADGLLSPVKREGTAEYRYYDCSSVMHVLQILSLQKMGFTRKEIHDYFKVPGDFNSCLAVLQRRQQQLNQMVERMQLRVDLSNHMKIERLRLPEAVCYAKSVSMDHIDYPIEQSWSDYHRINNTTQMAFKEAIDYGLSIDCSNDFFTLVDAPELLQAQQPSRPFRCQTCIPLAAAVDDPHVTIVPACDAISITWYHGQPEPRHEAYLALGKAIRDQQLIPDGPLRVIGIIHQYMGTDISVERNVIRIAQPIHV